MQTIWQDVKYGLRMLFRNPAFTLVAVLTLALGIGANTAVFGVINAFMIRPLPGTGNERLLAIAEQRKDDQALRGVSYMDLQDYRAHADAFTDMTAYTNTIEGISVDHRTERVLGQSTAGNFFSFLGLQPAAGRLFFPGEGESFGSAQLVVLGYHYWQRSFQGSMSVVGKSVLVNGEPATIIGVAPKELIGPYMPLQTDAYFTLGLGARYEHPGLFSDRGNRDLRVLGRPKPGVSIEQARSSLRVVAEQLAQQFPSTNAAVVPEVVPEHLARPEPDAAKSNPVVAGAFLGMVGLVLIITCVNVANLVLVRASTRFKEMAIRASMGAGRTRIFRQLLTESLVLSLLGGVAGALLGWWFTYLIASIHMPVSINIKLDLGFDWRVFGYIALIVFLSGLAVGLVPAWRASRMNLNMVLREGGRSGSGASSHQRMRSVLVAAQVAGTLVVLIVAGLFVRSMQSTQSIDLGFNPNGVLNLGMDTSQLGYDEARSVNFFRSAKERAQATPGVVAASLAISTPLGYYNSGTHVWKEGQRNLPVNEALSVGYNAVDEDYFSTLQVPILKGRAFTKQDTASSLHVAIINETMAKRLWPGEDAVGHHFSYNQADAAPVEVVGVAKNGRYFYAAEDPTEFFYLPLTQHYSAVRVLHVRASVPPTTLASAIQGEIHSLDPNLPVYDVEAMRQSLDGPNGFFLARMGAFFASIFGFLGLVLALVGVYGIISYAVTLRTQEIGVRMALGAQGKDVLTMILRQGFVLTGWGLLAGLAVSFTVTRFLKSVLFQVSAFDPITYVTVSTLLLAITLLACYLPARRATHVDPLVALHYE
jgi:macrolide transport system ATP-binding/permease protein